MKLLLILTAAATLAMAQQKAAITKTDGNKAPLKNAAAAESITLPASAKPIADGTWEHTDSTGKQWIYKKMPFGLTKFAKADFEARAAGANAVPPELTVVEEDGAYKFTRRTPFGGVSYKKKTDELNETERAVVAAHNRKAQNK